MKQIKKSFPDSSEVFISFWAHVPPGNFFPGKYWKKPDGTVGDTTFAELEKFSKSSSWKMAWFLQDGQYDGSTSDICAPTHTGSGSFKLAGNDTNIANLGKGDLFWSWNHFTRLATWMKADESDATLPGDYNFQAISRDVGLYSVFSDTVPVFDTDGPTDKYFNSVNVPGWLASNSDSLVLYDNIYLAIGPNAVTRVELADSPTYLGVTRVSIQLPIEWTDSQIRVSINEIGMDGMDLSDLYLYVYDSEGNPNTNGYPLK